MNRPICDLRSDGGGSEELSFLGHEAAWSPRDGLIYKFEGISNGVVSKNTDTSLLGLVFVSSNN
jgi:hypothetical protein